MIYTPTPPNEGDIITIGNSPTPVRVTEVVRRNRRLVVNGHEVASKSGRIHIPLHEILVVSANPVWAEAA